MKRFWELNKYKLLTLLGIVMIIIALLGLSSCTENIIENHYDYVDVQGTWKTALLKTDSSDIILDLHIPENKMEGKFWGTAIVCDKTYKTFNEIKYVLSMDGFLQYPNIVIKFYWDFVRINYHTVFSGYFVDNKTIKGVLSSVYENDGFFKGKENCIWNKVR